MSRYSILERSDWRLLFVPQVLRLELRDQIGSNAFPHFPAAAALFKAKHDRCDRYFDPAHIAPAHCDGSHFLIQHLSFSFPMFPWGWLLIPSIVSMCYYLR